MTARTRSSTSPPPRRAAPSWRRIEVPVVLPEGPRAAAWVDDNLREGDVYLENPTVA